MKLRTYNSAKQGYNEFDAEYSDVLDNLRNTKVTFITRKLYGPPVDDEDDDDSKGIDGSVVDKQSNVPLPDVAKKEPTATQPEVQAASVTEKQEVALTGTKQTEKPPTNPHAPKVVTDASKQKENTMPKHGSSGDLTGIQRVPTHPKWIGPSEDEVPVTPGVKGPKKRLTQIPRHNAGAD